MIPKEAIEAAISAYMKETDTEPHHLKGWFEPAMSAALTAAFAAMSEPVAWVSQNTLSTLADGHEGAFKEAISNKPFSRFSIPLYAAPQPAAVLAAMPAQGVVKMHMEHLGKEFEDALYADLEGLYDPSAPQPSQDLASENERLRAALEKIARRTSITFGAPHSMSAQEAFDIAKAALERT